MSKILSYIFALSLLLPTLSCSDWFDVPSDNENIPDYKYFGDESAFYNALVGVYTQLRDADLYGENLTLGMLEYMGQNLVPTDATSQSMSKFCYDDAAVGEKIVTVMREMYRSIAACNRIIAEIERTDVVFYNVGQKEIIAGELYALRGALHFDLLRLFHPSYTCDATFEGISYETDFAKATDKPLTTEVLIDSIVSDITRGADLLYQHDPVLSGKNSYIALPGEIDSRTRTFFLNYYAATALLARVYLYKGDYVNAYSYAEETFNHLRKLPVNAQIFYYVSPGKYISDFCFSREHIWGISSLPNGFTALSDSLFATIGVKVRSDLSVIYPDVNDTRFREWFTLCDDGTYTLQHKFGASTLLTDYVTNSGGTATDLPARIPMIKLGEVALIAAESLNEQNLPDEAAEWLIEMQESKRNSIVSTLKAEGKISVENIRMVIADEYRREFWGEGQLFYFYKRKGLSPILSSSGHEIIMTESEYTLPIPSDIK